MSAENSDRGGLGSLAGGELNYDEAIDNFLRDLARNAQSTEELIRVLISIAIAQATDLESAQDALLSIIQRTKDVVVQYPIGKYKTAKEFIFGFSSFTIKAKEELRAAYEVTSQDGIIGLGSLAVAAVSSKIQHSVVVPALDYVRVLKQDGEELLKGLFGEEPGLGDRPVPEVSLQTSFERALGKFSRIPTRRN